MLNRLTYHYEGVGTATVFLFRYGMTIEEYLYDDVYVIYRSGIQRKTFVCVESRVGIFPKVCVTSVHI